MIFFFFPLSDVLSDAAQSLNRLAVLEPGQMIPDFLDVSFCLFKSVTYI